MADTGHAAYYVYYRVAAGQAGAAQVRLHDLFERVRRTSGVQGRWLRKTGEPLLWMEIYEPVIDASSFEPALRRAMDETGFNELLQPGSARTIERFDPCD